ncbi:unnamed protein product, partial [Heterosigma akashiwo]
EEYFPQTQQFKVNAHFALDPEEAAYKLSLEIPMPIDIVCLQSTVRLTCWTGGEPGPRSVSPRPEHGAQGAGDVPVPGRAETRGDQGAHDRGRARHCSGGGGGADEPQDGPAGAVRREAAVAAPPGARPGPGRARPAQEHAAPRRVVHGSRGARMGGAVPA